MTQNHDSIRSIDDVPDAQAHGHRRLTLKRTVLLGVVYPVSSMFTLLGFLTLGHDPTRGLLWIFASLAVLVIATVRLFPLWWAVIIPVMAIFMYPVGYAALLLEIGLESLFH